MALIRTRITPWDSLRTPAGELLTIFGEMRKYNDLEHLPARPEKELLVVYAPVLNGDNLTGFMTAKSYTDFGSRRLGERPDRLASDVYNGTSANESYYPYGEEVTPTAGDGYKFATYNRDAATGCIMPINDIIPVRWGGS